MHRSTHWAVVAIVAVVSPAPPPRTASHVSMDASCQGGWAQSRAPGTRAADTLHGVTAIGSSDAWAVGQSNQEGVTRTLAEHWDGSVWSIVSTPDPDAASNGLFGVAGSAPGDVWAVGATGSHRVLALRWNGAAWSVVDTPSPGQYGGFLADVAAVAEDDAWAVGLSYGFGEGYAATLVEHWDGSAWKIVSSPSPTPNSYLTRVAADTGGDVWAIGHQLTGLTDRALVESWDGTAWNVVADPPDVIAGLAVFGPDDVWAAGWTRGLDTQPAFEHWDGSGWVSLPGPPVPAYGQILDLTGPQSNRLWAVGTQDAGVLIERWDGLSWKVVPAPSPQNEPPAMLTSVETWRGGAWTVGTTEINFGNPLIERTCRR